jgi:hypothetical protein
VITILKKRIIPSNANVPPGRIRYQVKEPGALEPPGRYTGCQLKYIRGKIEI